MLQSYMKSHPSVCVVDGSKKIPSHYKKKKNHVIYSFPSWSLSLFLLDSPCFFFRGEKFFCFGEQQLTGFIFFSLFFGLTLFWLNFMLWFVMRVCVCVCVCVCENSGDIDRIRVMTNRFLFYFYFLGGGEGAGGVHQGEQREAGNT